MEEQNEEYTSVCADIREEMSADRSAGDPAEPQVLFTEFRDTEHRYLVAECDAISGSKYIYRMISANRIDGLIPCSFREIEGKTYLYYEVTALAALASMSRGSNDSGHFGDCAPSEREQALLAKTMCSLSLMREKLAEYLLDAEDVLLNPEHIFVSSREEVLFLYLPEAKKRSDKDGFEDFFAFIKSTIRKDDRRMGHVLLAIEDTMASGREEALPGLLEEFRKKGYFEPAESVAAFSSDYEREFSAEETALYRKENKADAEVYERKEEEHHRPEEKKSKDKNVRKQRARKAGIRVQVCFAITIFFILGSFSLFFIPYVFSFSDVIQQWLKIGFIICSVAAMVSALAGILAPSARHAEVPEGAPVEAPDILSLREPEKAPSEKPLYIEETRNHSLHFEEEIADRRASDEMEKGESKMVIRLLGVKDRELKIELNRFPLSVGRSENYVDTVLKDASVDRMHAMFLTDEEGRICLRDLHSMTGTFVNGVALCGNERIALRDGDTVRFGEVLFQYSEQICYDVPVKAMSTVQTAGSAAV